MKPYAHQIEGALFLAFNPRGMLADEPRVGKTGASIIAADLAKANTVLVITTASGRAVWQRAFDTWSDRERSVQIIDSKRPLKSTTQVAIAGWAGLTNPTLRLSLINRQWDCVIVDEAHYAKNFEAKRTQALFGELIEGGRGLASEFAIVHKQANIWLLTGTPMPNSPADLYPYLRALHPDVLAANGDMPDVLRQEDFLERYTIRRPKKISNWNTISVVASGRNEEELNRRFTPLRLLRTQQDVGITEPIYETFPFIATDALLKDINSLIDADIAAKLKNRKNVTEEDLARVDLAMPRLRQLTGVPKARAIVDAVKEEIECGLKKIVIAYWHTEVGNILQRGLAGFGLVKIDGSTPSALRGEYEQSFLHNPKIKVCLAQIQAAGEAIDLSSSSELLFAEVSFSPKDMKQMSLRVTNFTQAGQPRVRVATLAGSLDDALQAVLMRKWSSINEVLK